jgi:hypothetical protein
MTNHANCIDFSTRQREKLMQFADETIRDLESKG